MPKVIIIITMVTNIEGCYIPGVLFVLMQLNEIVRNVKTRRIQLDKHFENTNYIGTEVCTLSLK